MIFVTVGAGDFNDLIHTMDELAPSLAAQGETVTLQIGHGSYIPRHTDFFRFAPSLEPYYQAADLVVSHGGIGTITEVLRLGKRLVGVSNPDRYDNHQDDLLAAMAGRGHLVWCRDLKHLADAIARARSVDLVPYRAEPCLVPGLIVDFVCKGIRPPHGWRVPADS